jgi:hypothetical protein
MSTDVTMQELEHAELLPSRETLWCHHSCCGCWHSGCYSNQCCPPPPCFEVTVTCNFSC